MSDIIEPVEDDGEVVAHGCAETEVILAETECICGVYDKHLQD